MSAKQRPLRPVGPTGMDIIFFYSCPHCGWNVQLLSPVQPALAHCDACKQGFPIMPVDERSLRYMRIMLANGKAAVDPDFA